MGGGGHEYVFLAGAISGFAEGITIQVRRATQRALATCAMLHAAALLQHLARPHAAARLHAAAAGLFSNTNPCTPRSRWRC